MIKLERLETIQVFQVELALKVKAKQSPFIAILILAKEEDGVSAETLQEKLLPTLPLRACSNLLKRLKGQEYLESTYGYPYEEDESDVFTNYTLTEFGNECAQDQTYWIGEKGVYNVFVDEHLFDCQLSNYHILRIEKVRELSDDRHGKNHSKKTPRVLSAYQKVKLNIDKNEYLIEEVENWCFQLPAIKSSLRLTSNGKETTLFIYHGDNQIFKTEVDIDELTLQNELLVGDESLDYDKKKRAILTDFISEDLSFHRKTMVASPVFRGIRFKQVELENIPYTPRDKKNAEKWYFELLLRNLNSYFFDEKDFKEYASSWASPFQKHFKLEVPTREEFLKVLKKKGNAFYSIARLDAIDYLNY